MHEQKRKWLNPDLNFFFTKPLLPVSDRGRYQNQTPNSAGNMKKTGKKSNGEKVKWGKMCHGYNVSECTYGANCRFKYVCENCGKNHSLSSCKQEAGRPAAIDHTGKCINVTNFSILSVNA